MVITAINGVAGIGKTALFVLADKQAAAEYDRRALGDRACEPVELGQTKVSPDRTTARAWSSPQHLRA